MKLTNGEIFIAKEPLEKLLAEKFPVKTSYALAKIANKLESQLKVIEKVRIGLVDTYGEDDPDSLGQKKVTPDCKGYDKFVEEIEELFSQEVEIVIDPVTLDGDLEIEPSVLMALERFIEVQ